MSKKKNKTAVAVAMKTPAAGAPTAIVTIDGKEYTLCFDMEAFERAERTFAAQGHDLNLLDAAVPNKTEHWHTLFVASLQRYHPDLTFEEAWGLWRLDTWGRLGDQTARLYLAAMQRPEAEKPSENPTEASPGS